MQTPVPHTWLHQAVKLIEADYQRSADTHLIPLALPTLATETGATARVRAQLA